VLTTILVATTACTIYSAALFTNLAMELFGARGVAYSTVRLPLLLPSLPPSLPPSLYNSLISLLLFPLFRLVFPLLFLNHTNTYPHNNR